MAAELNTGHDFTTLKGGPLAAELNTVHYLTTLKGGSLAAEPCLHGRPASHAGMVLSTNIKLISTQPWRRGCHYPILVDVTDFSC